MNASHETPTDRATWERLTDAALEKFTRDAVFLAFGRVQEGGRGEYAARRVWLAIEGPTGAPGERGSPRVRSQLLVAADEPNSAAPDVEAEGTVWRPFFVAGCDGCSAECERHGGDLEAEVLKLEGGR